MKGLLKGLRYISQIFDEEKKDEEIEIGYPTDVKHLTHIGSDGPSNNDLPSWMKEFKSETEFQSAPIAIGSQREHPQTKPPSQDSWRVNIAPNSVGNDVLELPKSSRRNNSLTDRSRSEPQPPKKKGSKSKQSRRQYSKEYSEGGAKSTRQIQETNLTATSSSQNIPDIPKKTRTKKSKELVIDGGGSSSKSRSKGDTSNGSFSFTSQYCENGSGSDTTLHTFGPPRLSPIPSLDGEEKGYT